MRLFALRHQYHLRHIVKYVLVACIAALVCVGAYRMACEYIATGYIVKQAEIERDAARLSNDEILQVLSGRLVMVEPIGGMAKVATIKWELVEIVK